MPKILNCSQCKKEFLSVKNLINCSEECKLQSRRKFVKQCQRCNTEYKAEKKDSKFCSHSCRSKELSLHNYAHERSGATRSKMELYIQENLTKDYPLLEKLYNVKNVIGSELDVYIPSLKLAIELNGIFHYENIFGKLQKTQERDKMKVSLCYEKHIGLCVIDTSNLKYFKNENALRYLKIITDIIDQRIKEVREV